MIAQSIDALMSVNRSFEYDDRRTGKGSGARNGRFGCGDKKGAL